MVISYERTQGHECETRHIVGNRYLSNYWRQEYTVTGESSGHPVWGKQTQVLWADGRVGEHKTFVGKDRVINQFTAV